MQTLGTIKWLSYLSCKSSAVDPLEDAQLHILVILPALLVGKQIQIGLCLPSRLETAHLKVDGESLLLPNSHFGLLCLC